MIDGRPGLARRCKGTDNVSPVSIETEIRNQMCLFDKLCVCMSSSHAVQYPVIFPIYRAGHTRRKIALRARFEQLSSGRTRHR